MFNRQNNEAVPEEFCGTMVHETFHAIDFILAGWGPYGMSDPSYNPSYVYLDDRGDDWLVECAARASESYVLGVPPSLSYAGECGTPIPDHHTAAVEEVLALAGII